MMVQLELLLLLQAVVVAVVKELVVMEQQTPVEEVAVEVKMEERLPVVMEDLV
jgi:hypothetical protein